MVIPILDPVCLRPAGIKTIEYEDGDRYEGQVKKDDNGDDQPHGRGKMFSADNSLKYDGEWQQGEWHGIGASCFSDGSRIVGEWTSGDLEGRATQCRTGVLCLDTPVSCIVSVSIALTPRLYRAADGTRAYYGGIIDYHDPDYCYEGVGISYKADGTRIEHEGEWDAGNPRLNCALCLGTAVDPCAFGCCKKPFCDDCVKPELDAGVLRACPSCYAPINQVCRDFSNDSDYDKFESFESPEVQGGLELAYYSEREKKRSKNDKNSRELRDAADRAWQNHKQIGLVRDTASAATDVAALHVLIAKLEGSLADANRKLEDAGEDIEEDDQDEGDEVRQ